MENKEEKNEEFKIVDEKLEKKKKEYKKLKILAIVLVIIFVCFFVLTIFIYNSANSNIDGANLKPIIYIYPEEETEVTVVLSNPENLSCSYPKYTTGWNVLAEPDGTLTDLTTGRSLYALYWEGKNKSSELDMTEGFVVKGEDTAEFLEEKLEILGLTEREAEEFIIYWLPKMEGNKYNFIRFETMEEINSYMELTISPEPDTLIRVMMDFKALDEKIEVEEQELTRVERTGYTVVEWGGSEY